ncbi:MAG: serine/threonine protein kinase [Pirellulales bacterium]|nr:serine/threonine protein kinase [Pirellulales bacterium]
MNQQANEPEPPEDPTIPQVSDFDLIRVIGEGGFGRVWLAKNQATGRLRAVKVIPLRGDGKPGGADPAGREICSITRLEANLGRQHPNLLNIHHVGKTPEHLFYVMDLADNVDGKPGSDDADYRPSSLQGRLEKGPLSADECLQYTRQLLAGLAFLHRSGMVHRDVKPANCLFLGGELKLADFGLLTEAGPQVSRVGTQTYMPPDGHMDARADVYAAGLVIYEMLSGLPAGNFPRLGERAREIVADPVLDVLMKLALRACEPDPSKRFTDAQNMLDELEADLLRATTGRSRAPHRTILAATVAALVLCLAAIAFWATRPRLVHVNFVTQPFEATIWLDGEQQVDDEGNPYRTPCTIEDLPAREHDIVFKLDGQQDLAVGKRDFAEERRIEERWESESR